MRRRPRSGRLAFGGTRRANRSAFHRRLTGMRLTPVQVQRLSGVDISVCTLVLDDLVRAQFLHLLSDGSYARKTAENASRSRMAKAVWNGSAAHSSRRVG